VTLQIAVFVILFEGLSFFLYMSDKLIKIWHSHYLTYSKSRVVLKYWFANSIKERLSENLGRFCILWFLYLFLLSLSENF
jgi:hypothetical protein